MKKLKPTPWKKKPKGLPAWVRAIPATGSHGSGMLQKRAWRLTSDYVRIRDYYAYNASCVATGARIGHWTEGDAGHYKSWSVCRGMFKFDPRNIHLQSKSSNGWGGQEVGYKFGVTLKQRYEEDYLEELESINKATPIKFTTQDILGHMINIITLLSKLPEQPAYYKRVVALLKTMV